jgi:hypothetical protein
MTHTLELLRIVPGEFSAVIRLLNPYEKLLDEAKRTLETTFPKLDRERDTRYTVFATLKNVIASTSLGLLHLENHVSKPEWWPTVRTIETSELDRTIHTVEFHQFVKIGFVHIGFSNVESALRSYVRAASPTACSGGAAEFKSIYEHLYRSVLGVGTDGIALLDVLRTLRNTIHNGGIFVSRTGADESHTYLGKTYTFMHGKAIEFASWGALAELHEHLANLLLRTVTDPSLSALGTILDARAGTLPPLVLGRGHGSITGAAMNRSQNDEAEWTARRNQLCQEVGRAVYTSQMLEQQLSLAVAVLNDALTLQIDARSLAAPDHKQSLGKLIGALDKATEGQFRDRPVLTDALEARNRVVHEFFVRNNDAFSDLDVFARALSALRADSRKISAGAVLMHETYLTLCSKYGIDESRVAIRQFRVAGQPEAPRIARGCLRSSLKCNTERHAA